MNADLDLLNKVLALGEKYGVTKIHFHPETGFMIEYSGRHPPKVEDVDAALPKSLNLGAPALCSCGHDELSHNGEGMCLHGCESTSCAEEVTQ